jgi:uncharacterized protein
MNLKQFWFQFFGLLLVAIIGLYFFGNPQGLGTFSVPFGWNPKPEYSQDIKDIAIVDGVTNAQKAALSVEIADESSERSRGLSGRDNLATNSGMLFTYDSVGVHKFWMKGMKFSLDFIWIKGDQIVDLLPNVPPPAPGTPDAALPVYGSNFQVDKILEVNTGFIANNNIKVGDKLFMIK